MCNKLPLIGAPRDSHPQTASYLAVMERHPQVGALYAAGCEIQALFDVTFPEYRIFICRKTSSSRSFSLHENPIYATSNIWHTLLPCAIDTLRHYCL